MNHEKKILVIVSLVLAILSLSIAFFAKDNLKVYIILVLMVLLGIMIYKNFDKILNSFKKDKPIQKTTNQNKTVKKTVSNKEEENIIKPVKSEIFFDDVIGMNEVKEEFHEIIDFIKNPAKYKKFGIKLSKGILLVGPPGVGKTMIAKAVANECGIPFFYESGSSFAQIYVGSGPKKVRELFNSAKKVSPAIVFIDEIDSVGKARTSGQNDERINTLNELLTQMDGFGSSSSVIVMAATNKIEVLDDALLRAGRFDKRLFLSLPQYDDRKQILNSLLKKVPNSVDIEKIAKSTVGFNNASLDTLVNEASLYALKNDKDLIDNSDFDSVIDKVFVGKKSKLSLSIQEKQILATYQVSKAIGSILKEVSFEKVELLNFVFNHSDKQIQSKTELIKKVQIYLAGSVGLELIYQDSFSCAKDDIKNAQKICDKIVNDYFMENDFNAKELLTQQRVIIKKEILPYIEKIIDISKQLCQKEVLSFEELKSLL
jgi:cell division protease FtsH